MNRFAVMLQTNLVATHNIKCGIDWLFLFAFLPLDKNQKSKFQKPWFCAFWKKLLTIAYFSTFLYNFLETLAY